MTEDEYQNLIIQYGEVKAKKCVEELSIYKKSKGVEYADDYSTIKRWVINRVEELDNKNNKNIKSKAKNTFKNYEQREYPDDFWDSFYSN